MTERDVTVEEPEEMTADIESEEAETEDTEEKNVLLGVMGEPEDVTR